MALRKSKRLSQEALAERIGTSSEWVSQIERGVGNPSFALLEKFAVALGTTFEEILAPVCEGRRDAPEVQELVDHARDLTRSHVRVLIATARALRAEEEKLGVLAADVATDSRTR